MEKQSVKPTNINTKGTKANTFDAIVIGSGISGGWAAKELCEKGLKTLVLERGRNVEHIKDYTTATKAPWEMPHSGQIPLSNDERKSNSQAVVMLMTKLRRTFLLKDKEHPYKQVKPFDWIRGYQVGGKSLMWGRWTQRWSDLDFEANAKQGIGVDWPIRYNDIAPWYSYVEKFVGISGNRDGIPHLPDGEFLPPMEMNAIEKHLQKSIAQNYTRPAADHIAHRQSFKRIKRPRALSIPEHVRTRMSLFRIFQQQFGHFAGGKGNGEFNFAPFSVVHAIIYDESKQKAIGVSVIDTQTHAVTEFYSKIIFVNAGTLNTTLLFLNSTSSRFPKWIW